MLTNYLAACAHLTITFSEIERDICEKVVILSYPLAFDAPVRGVPVRISAPPLVWKSRMVSLSEGEKNFEDMFIRFDVIHERDRRTDGQTDGHCMTAKTALASHRVVKTLYSTFCTVEANF